MIDVSNIRKDVINHGVLSVYEYTIDLPEGEEPTDVLMDFQVKDIIENKYDLLRVHVNMIAGETNVGVTMLFIKGQNLHQSQYDVDQLIYSSLPNDDLEITQVILTRMGDVFTHEMKEYTLAEASSSDENQGD